MTTLATSAVKCYHHNVRHLKYKSSAWNYIFSTRVRSAEYSTATSSSDKPALEISDDCARKLQEIAKDGTFLRITVEGGGCAGFQYKFNLDKETNSDDRFFVKNGAKVVIDGTSLEYVKGSTIDYHTELIRSSFRIVNNPMAELGCSCGASFTIKI